MSEASGIDLLLRHAETAIPIERGVADPRFATAVVTDLDADYVLYATRASPNRAARASASRPSLR